METAWINSVHETPHKQKKALKGEEETGSEKQQKSQLIKIKIVGVRNQTVNTHKAVAFFL